MREHRLAEEDPAERKAVEAAGQLVVAPGLHRMRVPQCVQAPVGESPFSRVIHVPLCSSRGTLRAGLDHSIERGIDADVEFASLDPLAQASATS